MGPETGIKQESRKTGRRESRKNLYRVPEAKTETSPYCGHVFDVNRTPRKSCNSCWDFFFTMNAEHTKNLIISVTAGYWREIQANYGSEYLKQLERFVAAVKAQEERRKRMDELETKLGFRPDAPLEDETFDIKEWLDNKFAERAEAATV